MSNKRIPDISDDLLLEIYKHVRPVRKNMMGKLCWLKEYSLDELRHRSYIWDDADMTTPVEETSVKLRPIGTFKCLHTWGAPSFFKPSIAEVLAQIPIELLGSAFAFQIIGMPETVNDFYADEFTTQAFKDGCHVSTVEIYAAE